MCSPHSTPVLLPTYKLTYSTQSGPKSEELKAGLKDSSGQKRARIIKRLEVVDAFLGSGNKPEWMVMDVVPVIPPDLRPMVQLDGGRFATSILTICTEELLIEITVLEDFLN